MPVAGAPASGPAPRRALRLMLDVVAAVLTIAAIAVLATGGIRLGRWTVTRERYDEIGRAGSWVVLARKS